MFKLLLEIVGVVLVVAGVAMWSVPVAFVVAGSCIVAGVEVRA